MSDPVRHHYELYPYPNYPLLASVRRCDTYHLNLAALWSRFNGELPPSSANRILIAGCGSFAPYPFAVANRPLPLVALDLSLPSLRRARLHCLLHGITGVTFLAGDLCDPRVAPGTFGLIDAFGVLHHLEEPLAGLRALAGRLTKGGILRVMVYSRYARREEESIRRALRMLRVVRPEQVQAMVRRSGKDSRLRRFFEASDEVAFRSGVADALLHPCVHSFRIDPFLEMVAESGLTPLQFAHRGALAELDREVERIRELESARQSPGNFVLYLGKEVKGPCLSTEALFRINPCIAQEILRRRLGALQIHGRIGHSHQPLTRTERRFLARFQTPVPASQLTADELAKAERYGELLFLLRYRPSAP